MKPQPNSHFPPSFTDNNADTEDAGNSSNSSSSSANEQRQSRPRMRSPETAFMTIDGVSEDESSTVEPRRGFKRAWPIDISPSDETEKLPSTEPRNKKQRLQEPQEQSLVGAAKGSSDPVSVEDLRERVNRVCDNLHKMNQGLPFADKDTFILNAFAHFTNALEQACAANEAGLVQRLLETGMQNSVPEALDSALAIANSMGAEKVLALLTQGVYASLPSSASSSSSATAPAAGWQNQVQKELSDEAIKKVQEGLEDQNNSDQALALLFGENKAQWPLGQFSIRKISLIPLAIKQLLRDCGAVIVGINVDKIDYVMYAADFDTPRFREGLVALLKEEQNQSSDDSSDNSSDELSDDGIYSRVFTFSAEWGDLEIVKELLKNGAAPHAKDYDNETALIKATSSGNIEIVRLLLEAGADINAMDPHDLTALTIAAAEGHIDICQLLLDKGALLEVEGAVSALHVAAENGHVAACRLLINTGVNVDHTEYLNDTPLGMAAKNGQLAVCKLLLELGANINHTNQKGKSILYFAISSGNLELVQYLLADGTGLILNVGDNTPLIMASQKNKTNIMAWLLAVKAPVNQPNKNNHTALMSACSGGAVEAVALLLQNGAKMDMTNNAGMTPLLLAVNAYEAGIVELLIDQGVPLISDRHEGFKALELAVKNDSERIISLLLQAYVPVEPVKFIDSSRPPSLLNIAIQSKDKWSIGGILEPLLKYSASTRRTDANGDNALMLAAKRKLKSVIDLLGKYGAQIGQTNQQDQNALQIAIETLDLSVADSASPEDIATNAELVVSLLKIMQTQPDWAELRAEALNRARHPLTRELILLAWAWKNMDSAVIGNIAKNNVNFQTIQNFIASIITAKPADFSREKIEYMLSMAGVCPPLIEQIFPYIKALPEIVTQLFGPQKFNPIFINTFLAGAFATLESIRPDHGEHWAPYGKLADAAPLFNTLNQIANLELTQLINSSLATEKVEMSPIFENIFETCFNLTYTAQKPFATLPAYSAADGELTLALVNKGVYFMLAARIENAWKKAWTEIFSSQESNRASSSSSSARSAEAVILPDDTSSIYTDTADMGRALIGEMDLPDASSFPDSPLGLALLQAFRNALRIAFNTPGDSVLDLKDVSPAAAQIYASLMHRPLHMLNQFIEWKDGL